MQILKKRVSLQKKIHLNIITNPFTSLTSKQTSRVLTTIKKELNRRYSVKISSYDWRIAMTAKRHFPQIKTTLLLPNLVLHPETTIAKTPFYKKYKKTYLFHQSFYGKDCDWFFTFNPRKYFMELSSLRRATGADRILLTNSCRRSKLSDRDNIHFFISYKQYSELSKRKLFPTWNHKFKSHLVSLADYYQLADCCTNNEAKKFLASIGDAADQAEKASNNNHREGMKIFYSNILKTYTPPNIEAFKNLWAHPIALNKISDIYASLGDTKNYILSKKIELNLLLNLNSKEPQSLTDEQLINAMHLHLKKEILEFKFRNAQDESFFKLIKGKDIAIVGPAPSIEAQGSIIDSFEHIIRLRFPVKTTSDILLTGRKTTIINNSLAFSNKLKGQITYNKDIFLTYQSAIPRKDYSKNARVLFELQKNLLTMPHAIPRILIDLIAFSPSKIKIFNTTMLLEISGKKYNTEYREKVKEVMNAKPLPGEIANRLSFFYHDPLVNILIMKTLFHNKYFCADTVLTKILGMSIDNYIYRLFKQEDLIID